jgi:hypothetical protein
MRSSFVGRVPVATAILSTLVTACGTFVTETPINRSPHLLSPRPPGSVEVFSSGPPPRSHVDVAFLEAEQTHGLNSQRTGLMIERLRARAADMGCDGIVIGGVREKDGAQPGSGWDILDPGSTTMHATCIVYRTESPGISPMNPTAPPAR